MLGDLYIYTLDCKGGYKNGNIKRFLGETGHFGFRFNPYIVMRENRKGHTVMF